MNSKNGDSTGPCVLFDLDETLIDRSYQTNASDGAIQDSFRRAIDGGAVLGLNSDTPIRTLRDVHSAWNLNGPIVGERGALIFTEQGEVIDLSHEAAKQFCNLRELFVRALQQNADVTVLPAQASDLDQLVSRAPGNRRLIVFHPYRERSLSFWARTGGLTGDSARNEALLEEAVAMLNAIMAEQFPEIQARLDIAPDINKNYCICVMHLQDTQKTIAVKRLLERWPRIYMIGNSMSDWIDDAHVVHGAVNNANLDFQNIVRNHGGHIANSELTKGAIELLEWAIVDSRQGNVRDSCAASVYTSR